ncbi:hypothetical protein BVY03_05290 [bacterium K02(2017)]|nr:hypothetical protein BVY03_05290 [bacterium K02(2017)]
MSSFIKYLSQNIFLVFLVFGIVVAVNFLSLNSHYRFDLTDEKEYTLADSSIKILDRLEDRLTIKLYYSKDLPAALIPIKQGVDDIIKEFKAYSKQTMIVDYVDPELNEEREREVKDLGIVPLQLNVVEKDKQEVRKAYMGMILYYQDKKQVIPVLTNVKNMEYLMDLSVLNLTQKNKPRIGVFVGGNQSKFKLVDELVKQLGELVPIDPEKHQLDKLSLSALVVINPVEVKKEFVEEWDVLLENGVSVLVFTGNIDVQDDMKPNQIFSGVEDWLAQKGVGVSGRLLLDVKQNQQAGFNTGFMNVYVGYPFWVKAFKNELNSANIITAGIEEVLFPWTNVLTLFKDKDVAWQAETLVWSSPKSFLQQEDIKSIDPHYVDDMTEMPKFDQYPLAVNLKYKEANKKMGQIFVTGTHHLLQDRFLQSSQSNMIFLNNLLESTSWGDFLIGVRSRGKTARPLADLDSAQKFKVKWGTTIFVPLLAIAFGLIGVWGHRKRRLSFINKLDIGN